MDDTRDQSTEYIVIIVVLTIFASVFVAARLWTRMFKTQAFGLDDGFIIVAWVSLSVHSCPSTTCSWNFLRLRQYRRPP